MGNLSQKFDFASYAFFAVILLYTVLEKFLQLGFSGFFLGDISEIDITSFTLPVSVSVFVGTRVCVPVLAPIHVQVCVHFVHFPVPFNVPVCFPVPVQAPIHLLVHVSIRFCPGRRRP